MKNAIICKNCGSENPVHRQICLQCNGFLRDKVVNIDLFSMMLRLVESPGKAFLSVVYAEHKNYIFYLSVLLGLKYSIDSAIIKEYTFNSSLLNLGFTTNAMISVLVFIVILFLFSAGIKFAGKMTGYSTRYLDNFSLLVYSQLPHLFSLLFIFPVEIVLFGGYLFSRDPSPFLLKPTSAYLLAGMEVLMIVWSIVFTAIAFYTQTRSRLVSVALSIKFNIIILLLILLLSAL